jgi:hypothetical protein
MSGVNNQSKQRHRYAQILFFVPSILHAKGRHGVDHGAGC